VRRGRVRVGSRLVSYREAGSEDGPVVLLAHGVGSDSGTWEPAMPELAARGLRVLAPDLLGLGEAVPPRRPAIGHSLAPLADLLRDLLVALGLPGATIVGHSFGGAIAIWFAHHHPRHTQRLVLISSGGLGKGVHPILRAATLPGGYPVLRLAFNHRTDAILRAPALHRLLRLSPMAADNLVRASRVLADPVGRVGFVTSLRSVVRPSGQRASMVEGRVLDPRTPTMIIWSVADRIVPVAHAHALHQYLPGSRLELFPGASHVPYRRFPQRFATVLADFVTTTSPRSPGPQWASPQGDT